MRPLAMLFVSLAFALPAAAAPVAEPVDWTIGDTAFQGTLVYDDAATTPRPGLLMMPNWMGANDAAVEHAKEIAGTDYVVLVADVYGADVRPESPQEASAAAGSLRDDRPLMRARAQKALEVLRAQSGAPLDLSRIAAIGFCFGGTVALELARDGADIDAAVSFHGGLSAGVPADPATLKAGILVLNGAEDRGVKPEDIAAFQDEMRKAGADWTFVNFGGAVHCFSEPSANRPPGCVYHERAARRAFAMMHDFLADRFNDERKAAR